MRQQIFDRLFRLMEEDDGICLATADMGINLVERFAESYPERFVNVGIAEQNLIGVAAGLANVGMRPFVYTISNFLIHRCFEQIRNDLVLHSYPVTLVGTSTGYDNAPLGPTHHVIDDWGCLKGLLDIDIYCPSSAIFAEHLVEQLSHASRPAYVRVPKGNFAAPDSTEDAVLMPGNSDEILLVSYGSIAQNCLEVQSRRPEVSLLVLNRLYPLPEVYIGELLRQYRHIITAEDHFPHSGIYASLAELCGRQQIARPLTGLGPHHGYELRAGRTADYYHRQCRIDPAGIEAAIVLACEETLASSS